MKPSRFKQLAVRVFGINLEGKSEEEAGLEGIKKQRQFRNSIRASERLEDYNIDDNKWGIMADRAMTKGKFGNFAKLNREDVLAIYRASLYNIKNLDFDSETPCEERETPLFLKVALIFGMGIRMAEQIF